MMKERIIKTTAHLFRMILLIFFLTNLNGCIGAFMAKKMTVKAFDQLNQNDIEAFLENYGDDAVMIYPGDVSASGETKGNEAVREWFTRMSESGLRNNFTLKNICVEDIFAFGGTNVVAAHWENNVINKHGEKVTYHGVSIIKVVDRKVVSVHDYIFETDLLKKVWGEE
ncbi:MAG: nuclear transport factor 2 family protein [Deltaproteobacteria bacterium]|nr:nuclear transport factor 2 family protein [Deltaproteobacteria bacterium]